jgi:hypothetical protein
MGTDLGITAAKRNEETVPGNTFKTNRRKKP